MWKLALNHANFFSKQQTMGKMSHHELLSPDNSRSAISSCLKKHKSGGLAAIRMSWYTFFEKINSRGGGVYSGRESTYRKKWITRFKETCCLHEGNFISQINSCVRYILK